MTSAPVTSYSSCVRAASYSVGAHSAFVHEINGVWDDDDDETTDAREVVDAQTADDP